MEYDYREKKIVAVLNSALETGVALNVVGHLAVSIGCYAQEHMGKNPLLDADGVKHLGIARYPFIITKAKPNKIRAAIEKARENDNILFADYPQQMLETGHDNELAESLAKAQEKDLSYLGAVFYGPTEDINEITGKFSLYK
uniref:DUF2000 domain-containing protein n=1 Tax=Agathobacter sp. TaxID=2021311 RepID=UPI0040568A7F